MNGVTRGKVLAVSEQAGIPALRKDFSLVDVFSADEVFVTGTFGGITPVSEIDGRSVGGGALPGPMTQRLIELYDKEVGAYIAKSTA